MHISLRKKIVEFWCDPIISKFYRRRTLPPENVKKVFLTDKNNALVDMGIN